MSKYTYSKAGVDINKGNKFIENIKKDIGTASTDFFASHNAPRTILGGILKRKQHAAHTSHNSNEQNVNVHFHSKNNGIHSQTENITEISTDRHETEEKSAFISDEVRYSTPKRPSKNEKRQKHQKHFSMSAIASASKTQKLRETHIRHTQSAHQGRSRLRV